MAFESQFGRHRMGLMVNSDLGYAGSHHAPVLLLGGSIPYKNQTLWLRLDLPEISSSTLENVHETTRVARKRLGEPGFMLPPSERFLKNVSEERMKTASDNIKWLKANPEIFSAIVNFHANFRYPEVPNVDADAALYVNGFISKQTEELGRRFIHADFQSKVSMLKEFREKTPSQIAKRILFRNFPESLDIAEIKTEHKSCINSLVSGNEEAIPVDHRGSRKLTPEMALKIIDEILAGKTERIIDPDQQSILSDLRNYVVSEFDERKI